MKIIKKEIREIGKLRKKSKIQYIWDLNIKNKLYNVEFHHSKKSHKLRTFINGKMRGPVLKNKKNFKKLIKINEMNVIIYFDKNEKQFQLKIDKKKQKINYTFVDSFNSNSTEKNLTKYPIQNDSHDNSELLINNPEYGSEIKKYGEIKNLSEILEKSTEENSKLDEKLLENLNFQKKNEIFHTVEQKIKSSVKLKKKENSFKINFEIDEEKEHHKKNTNINSNQKFLSKSFVKKNKKKDNFKNNCTYYKTSINIESLRKKNKKLKINKNEQNIYNNSDFLFKDIKFLAIKSENEDRNVYKIYNFYF